MTINANGHLQRVTWVRCSSTQGSVALPKLIYRLPTRMTHHPHHRTDRRPTVIPPINHAPASKRRSKRIALNAAVTLSGEDRQKRAFTMPALATNLNKHGAAIQLKRDLAIGAAIKVQNARGSQASARVVAQVRAAQGVHTYGVEFLEDGSVKNFWGISFPSTASGAL